MADQKFHTEITASSTQFNAEMEAAAQKMLSDGQRMQSGWREGFVQMGQAGGGMVKQLNGQFDQAKETIKNFRGALAGATAVVAGATFLVKLATDAQRATKETESLAIILGTTTQEASALKVALDDIGVETEVYTGAVSKLTTGLRENESRFNELGVKTRDANGNLLSTDIIIRNAFSALEQFKGGTDRNLASTELFAKSWQEVNRLMKLTPDVMEAARIKAVELETQVGPAGAERADRYRRAISDVNDVWEAMKNRVGQALMPVLTNLSEWLSSIGPAAITVVRGAVGGFVAVWHGLANAVNIAWQLIKAFLFNVTEPIVGLGHAVALALSGNFEAAGQRLRQITPSVKAAWENAWAETLRSSEKTKADLLALFSFESEQGTGSGEKDQGTRKFTPKRDGSRMAQWEAELAAMRDAHEREQFEQNSFQEFAKEKESAFWRAILQMGGLSREEAAAVSKKYYGVEREIRKAAFETEIADIKAKLELHKQGADERIAIFERIAAKMRERFGADSKEAKQAEGDVLQASRENAERAIRLLEMDIEARRNHHMHRLELERANLDQLETLGVINGREKVSALRVLKETEFQIELEAAQSRAQLLANDVEAYRAAMEKIAEIRRKHEVDMKVIDNRELEERKKVLSKWFDPISDAMQTMVNGVLQGTQRLSTIMRNALRNIAAQYAVTGLKIALDWIKNQILMTTATTASVTARTAAETAGAAATTTSNATTATASIGAKAWEAAAGVYASIAQIPYIGPFLAPVMAIAAAATVLGFIGKIASASGGFDIPSGVNPVTQLHQEEMVLPADIANPLRAQLAGGGGSGGGTHIHFHAPVYGQRDFKQAVAKAASSAARINSNNFRLNT